MILNFNYLSFCHSQTHTAVDSCSCPTDISVVTCQSDENIDESSLAETTLQRILPATHTINSDDVAIDSQDSTGRQMKEQPASSNQTINVRNLAENESIDKQVTQRDNAAVMMDCQDDKSLNLSQGQHLNTVTVPTGNEEQKNVDCSEAEEAAIDSAKTDDSHCTTADETDVARIQSSCVSSEPAVHDHNSNDKEQSVHVHVGGSLSCVDPMEPSNKPLVTIETKDSIEVPSHFSTSLSNTHINPIIIDDTNTDNQLCQTFDASSQSCNNQTPNKSSQLLSIDKESSVETPASDDLMGLPLSLEDRHLTTVGDDGIGVVAVQQLDDSLTLQDIEDMYMDFDDFNVELVQQVNAPIKHVYTKIDPFNNRASHAIPTKPIYPPPTTQQASMPHAVHNITAVPSAMLRWFDTNMHDLCSV